MRNTKTKHTRWIPDSTSGLRTKAWAGIPLLTPCSVKRHEDYKHRRWTPHFKLYPKACWGLIRQWWGHNVIWLCYWRLIFDLTNLISNYLPRYISGKETFEIPISAFSVAVKVIESLCWSDSFLLTRLQKNVNFFYYEKKSSCRGLPRASINENAAQCACGCPIVSEFYACCVCQLQIHERTRYPLQPPPPSH